MNDEKLNSTMVTVKAETVNPNTMVKVPKHYNLTVSYESGVVWDKDGTLKIPSSSQSGDPYSMGVDPDGQITCQCIGSNYWVRCRHQERAAYYLENKKPRTVGQMEYAEATRNDHCRTEIRQGHRPEKVKRLKKSELARALASF